MAFSAIVIGLYPLLYFLMDVDFGLLATKPKEILTNRLWEVGFYGHIGFGGIALIVGWTQFHAGWRKRWMSMHRALGKVHVVAVILSALCGFYIAIHATGGWVAGLGFSLLAILWFVTTMFAYQSIRIGQVDRHQQWMIYSYALCLAAVTLRIWLPLLSSFLDFISAYRIVAWLCWLPNLMVAWRVNRPVMG